METTNAANTTTTPNDTPASKTYYIPLEKYMADAKIALTNAGLPDVAPLLEKRGYPATLITAKLTELAALEDLVEAQKKEYGEQYAATEAYQNAINELAAEYMEQLELARLVFKEDTAAKTALALKGKRKKSDSGFTAQALLFYNGLLGNATWKTAIAKKGVEEAELQAGKAGYENLNALAAAQTKETGEAQQATANRDEAYDTFGEWMDEFYETAEIALRKAPQLMEKIGLVQR